MRGAIRPASGAITIGARVHGVVRTAASQGEAPCTTCMYWMSRKIAPKVPKLKPKPAMLVTVKLRSRNNRIGTRGADVRACQATNPVRSAMPATSSAMTPNDPQPSSLPRTIAWTSRTTLGAIMTAPRRSSRTRAPRSLRRAQSAKGMARIAIGTFSQKIACQFQPSMIAPPTSGPTATPRPETPPQIPIASGRRSGATPPESSASDRGKMPAPPSPWTARATISCDGSVLRAANTEPIPNTAIPIAKTVRRPYRSPRADARRIAPAKASV